jgi:hypothetical protein
LPSRTTPDLLAGIWWLLERQLGAVPRRRACQMFCVSGLA